MFQKNMSENQNSSILPIANFPKFQFFLFGWNKLNY